jgi:hypothetical protein
MSELERLLGLFVAAVILAGGARRVGAPYPVFLALGDDAIHRIGEELDWLDMAGHRTAY